MKLSIGTMVKVIPPTDKSRNMKELWWIEDMNRYIGKSMTITGYSQSDNYILDNIKELGWVDEWFEDIMITLINEVTRK